MNSLISNTSELVETIVRCSGILPGDADGSAQDSGIEKVRERSLLTKKWVRLGIWAIYGNSLTIRLSSDYHNKCLLRRQ
jgi:hypothetical protein